MRLYKNDKIPLALGLIHKINQRTPTLVRVFAPLSKKALQPEKWRQGFFESSLFVKKLS